MSDGPTAAAEQGIAIGVIGPEVLVRQVMDTLRAFPSFQPLPRPYLEEDEILGKCLELMDKVEVLLFTDPVSHQLVKDKLHFSIPVIHVPLTGTGLYRALFRLEKQAGLTSFSVDTLSPQIVEKAFKELSLPACEAVYYKDTAHASDEQLIAFHRKQVEQLQYRAVLTCVRQVAEALTKLGIPNEWVIPTAQDTVVTLERALLSTETRRSKESQIVVGLVNVDDFNRVAVNKASEHEVQRLKLDIHRMVLGYVETLDGYMSHMGGDEYLFITTRGIFERETGGYKTIPLAREAEKQHGLSLSIGIGFGRSANDAGTHARIALRQSKSAGGNMCFIVREDQSMIGPLEMTEPLAYDLSLLDVDLLKQAENAGLTSVYLSKLIAAVTRTGRTDYIAQQLAAILGVTVRSTHRFLLSWLDAGMVEIVGEEKAGAKGRPKHIYRLTFLKNLIR
ncbi:hypothetical protein [Paenibacillus nasutitermitis]|uniref:Transcriptional regulator n=1 Tax=Paenibacillus nasutitermitis TaxID=1652958 RepID=A0A916ZBA5_9BACL|nr:hypothetical protein [Paenibacillus nasutitermitis]GGD86067.1 transcriptional regulator [Paenibacillus nasutitermitis]